MDTDRFLLIGGRERDGGDYGTGLLIWLRPNVDSPGSETVMTRFKGSSVGDGATVGEGGRLVEVRERGGHSHCSRGRGKGVEGKETVVISSGASIRAFIVLLDLGFAVFRAQDAI